MLFAYAINICQKISAELFDKGKYVLHYENSIKNTLIMQLQLRL